MIIFNRSKSVFESTNIIINIQSFVFWQKSVNAVRAVRKFSSISSLSNIGAKTKSQSVLKLNVEATFSAKPRPLSERNRDLSRSVPSVFSIDEGQFNKRAMMILESDNEERYQWLNFYNFHNIHVEKKETDSKSVFDFQN